MEFAASTSRAYSKRLGCKLQRKIVTEMYCKVALPYAVTSKPVQCKLWRCLVPTTLPILVCMYILPAIAHAAWYPSRAYYR